MTNDEKDPSLRRKTMLVGKVNWVEDAPKAPFKVLVKNRYRHPAVSAIIKPGKNGEYAVEFDEAQRAVSPGQSAVFYAKNGQMLGGGRIK